MCFVVAGGVLLVALLLGVALDDRGGGRQRTRRGGRSFDAWW